MTLLSCSAGQPQGSAARGHYYAGPGNRFWQFLHETGLTPERLAPEADQTLPHYGIGLTDLVKDLAQSHDRGLRFDMASLVAKLDRCRPAWVAFTSKKAGEVAAAALRQPAARLGVQPWLVGESRVFVLPSSSGANQRKEYDGRPTRLEWWVELAELVRGESAPAATVPTVSPSP